MVKRRLLTIAMLLAAPESLLAQVVKPLERNTEVRVTADVGRYTKGRKGIAMSVMTDSAIVRFEADSKRDLKAYVDTVPFALLEMKEGQRTRVVEGALIGLVAGGLLGWQLGYVWEDPCNDDPNPSLCRSQRDMFKSDAIAFAVGAVAGGVAGGAIGRSMMTDYWTPVIPRIGMRLIATPRAIGFALRVTPR